MRLFSILLSATLALAILPTQAAAGDLTGHWKFVRNNADTERILKLKQQSNVLSGSVVMAKGEIAFDHGQVNGSLIEFAIVRGMANGGTVRTLFRATVNGDTMQGTTQTGSNSPIAFTATRLN